MTVKHSITITESEAIAALPWNFSCSCGYEQLFFSSRDRVEQAGKSHRRRPQHAKAEGIAQRLRTGNLTDEETKLISAALLHAAWVDDVPNSIPVAAECALDDLVSLVRGES